MEYLFPFKNKIPICLNACTKRHGRFSSGTILLAGQHFQFNSHYLSLAYQLFYRCSPKAWEEKITRESTANPRLSITLATDNDDNNLNDRKSNGDCNSKSDAEKEIEGENVKNDQLLIV